MLSSIRFGKLLMVAIAYYNAGQYTEAEERLDKALSINKTDLIANFWKLQVSVKQGKIEEAIALINVCRGLKVATYIENLLTLWEEYCLRKLRVTTDHNIDIGVLDKETNQQLEYYQHYRTFNFTSILYAVLLYIGLSIALYVIFKTTSSIYNLSDDWLHRIAFLEKVLFAPIIMTYYYRKAEIVPNIYISFLYITDKLQRLLHSANFIASCFFIVFGIITVSSGRSLNSIPSDIFQRGLLASAIFCTPVGEEIVFRGILYGYLKKYGKIFSWTIVTLLFLLVHPSPSYWQAILGLVCLKIYDDERTILAPILVHILNNIMSALYYSHL